MNSAEEKNIVGCCGAYCALCPRYHSTAKSRCPGCKRISLTISCRIFNCCVKQRALITCAQCNDFPCEKNNPERFRWDTFVTRKVCVPNIERIKEVGLERWLEEQREKRDVLECLLANYNDGRSRSFYCIAATLMPVDVIKKAVDRVKGAMASNKVDASDMKAKARALTTAIRDLAAGLGVDLTLRKKPK